ncbi:hypothetical protein SAMN05216559_0354 [Halomicrobium zhouii]|uniref:Uncharacterized protein n=1 Tax=Halomicrobium zhouii TaxID=767519 RepID=A0A1I6K889_9EURY|nr:hypothetical protein [Halomicrobium zhouii]SFR87439.1 hypothetical protein SAMN05216559_0354 [Halomicrobium zhouii]
MGENSGSDTFRFQGQAVSDAVDVLDEYRGVDRDELGRRGVTRILREVTTGEEKAAVFTQYQRAEIDEDVARAFLGDRLDAMLADAEETREAIEEDETSDLVQ